MRLAKMFIVGAVPDSLIIMKKAKQGNQKGYKFVPEDERSKSPNRPKRSFWNVATGGRMK